MSENSRVVLARAYRAYKEGDFSKARSLVGRVIQAEPQEPNAWYMVGLLSTTEKTKRQAFQKALSLDPQHKYARAALDAMQLPLDPDSFSAPTLYVASNQSAQADHQPRSAQPEPPPADAPRQPSNKVGWLLPALVIVAGIGLLVLLLLVLRSGSATDATPTALALAQVQPTAFDTLPPRTLPPTFTTVPTRTKPPTPTPKVETATPTRKIVWSTRPTATPTLPTATSIPPTPNNALTTLTPSPVVELGTAATGQFLLAGASDLYSVNADGSNFTSVIKESREALRLLNNYLDGPYFLDLRWSPQQQILAVVNYKLVIIDIGGGLLNTPNTNSLWVEQAVWSPDAKRIAFIAGTMRGDDNVDIYVMNIDGTDLRQITTTARPYYSLDWSPDGSRLMYIIRASESVGVYTLDPNGGEPHMLAPIKEPKEVRWSPDGKYILLNVWTDQHSSDPRVLIIDTNGTTIYTFSEAKDIHAMAWSPDGAYIACLMSDSGGYGLYTFPLTGGTPTRLISNLPLSNTLQWRTGTTGSTPSTVTLPNANDSVLFLKSVKNFYTGQSKSQLFLLTADGQQHQLTNFQEYVADPTWLPDGRIAFVAQGPRLPSRQGFNRYERPLRIFVMNIDGTDLHQLTTDDINADNIRTSQYGPAWSPDGQRVAYLNKGGGGAAIRVMNADGTNDRLLGKFKAYDEDLVEQLTWSPDGRFLAMRMFLLDGSVGMITIDVDSGQVRLLTDLSGSQPVWSPDGTQIVFAGSNNPSPYAQAPISIYMMDSEGRNPHRILNEQYKRINGITWSSDGQHLVFSGEKSDGSAELYMIQPDGSGLQALTHATEPGVTHNIPHWKPRPVSQSIQLATPTSTPVPELTGLIAFSSRMPANPSDQDVLCFARLNDLVAHCQHRTAGEYNLRWSPDGTRLAYDVGPLLTGAIFVVESNGELSRLTTMESAFSPAWSPDGKQIAFIGWGDRYQQLYVMNADGSNPHRITDLPLWYSLEDAMLTWSPDGNTLLLMFNSMTQGTYALNPDGSNFRQLNKQIGLSPVYSPDGQSIAFVSVDYSRIISRSIAVMNADGTNVRQLTFSEGDYANPTWSPDGKYLLFASTRGQERNTDPPCIYIMNADGTNMRKFNNLKGYNAAWTSATDGFTLPD